MRIWHLLKLGHSITVKSIPLGRHVRRIKRVVVQVRVWAK